MVALEEQIDGSRAAKSVSDFLTQRELGWEGQGIRVTVFSGYLFLGLCLSSDLTGWSAEVLIA